MFRFLTMALLAGAAVPAAALAQDSERPATGGERREAAAAQRAERAPRPDGGQRADRGPRPDAAPRAERPAFDGQRSQGGQRQRDFSAPAAAAQVQAQPQARPDRGGWSNAGQQNRGNWRGDRQDRGTYTARGFGPSAAQPVPGNDSWNQTLQSDTTGRGGAINRARRDQQRDWDRRNDNRRDWNRDDRRRDATDGRRDWNDGRRWDGDRNAGNWNRNWRDDRRYDWQGYRSSNRSAYRLPRYYAPSGWGYGYRRFNVGTYLFAGLFARNYWIDDPYDYRLPPVQWPYQWVRYYDDALLVDTETGEVVDEIPGIFW